METGKCNTPQCRFAHGEAQLRATHSSFNMKLCSFAQSGRCRHGSECRFAHDRKELGPLPVNAEPDLPQDVPTIMTGQRAWSRQHGVEKNSIRSAHVGHDAVTLNIHSSIPVKESHVLKERSSWSAHRNKFDSRSWARSGNSSVTEVPSSERTGSSMTMSDDSSSGEGNHNKYNDAEIKATTLQVTNVPCYFTQGALLSMLEDLDRSLQGAYDFFYCPWDEKHQRNLGYAVINFVDTQSGAQFQQRWCGRDLCLGAKGQRALQVGKAPLQGLQANIKHFRKTAVKLYSERRFYPLVRDTAGILQPLEELPPDTLTRFKRQVRSQDLKFPVEPFDPFKPLPRISRRSKQRMYKGASRATTADEEISREVSDPSVAPVAEQSIQPFALPADRTWGMPITSADQGVGQVQMWPGMVASVPWPLGNQAIVVPSDFMGYHPCLQDGHLQGLCAADVLGTDGQGVPGSYQQQPQRFVCMVMPMAPTNSNNSGSFAW